jgi:hypothetical protein
MAIDSCASFVFSNNSLVYLHGCTGGFDFFAAYQMVDGTVASFFLIDSSWITDLDPPIVCKPSPETPVIYAVRSSCFRHRFVRP